MRMGMVCSLIMGLAMLGWAFKEQNASDVGVAVNSRSITRSGPVACLMRDADHLAKGEARRPNFDSLGAEVFDLPARSAEVVRISRRWKERPYLSNPVSVRP